MCILVLHSTHGFIVWRQERRICVTLNATDALAKAPALQSLDPRVRLEGLGHTAAVSLTLSYPRAVYHWVFALALTHEDSRLMNMKKLSTRRQHSWPYQLSPPMSRHVREREKHEARMIL